MNTDVLNQPEIKYMYFFLTSLISSTCIPLNSLHSTYCIFGIFDMIYYTSMVHVFLFTTQMEPTVCKAESSFGNDEFLKVLEFQDATFLLCTVPAKQLYSEE